MRFALAITLALTLVACALTPSELREQGVKLTHNSANSPRDAARCLARFIDEYRPFMDARFASDIREGAQPGHWEVRASGSNVLQILAEVQPSPSGSTVTLWQSPYLIYRSMSAEMVKGC